MSLSFLSNLQGDLSAITVAENIDRWSARIRRKVKADNSKEWQNDSTNVQITHLEKKKKKKREHYTDGRIDKLKSNEQPNEQKMTERTLCMYILVFTVYLRL